MVDIEPKNLGNLFAGRPKPLGGLSNEHELAQSCPPTFREENPWSDYAMKLFFQGGDLSNWRWQSEDSEEQRQQKRCFVGLIRSFGVSSEEKEAVAGWMLSEMLSAVPEHLPLPHPAE